ncbi:MAG: hypothetical protein ACLFVO_08640 [Chloroflexaceae bacterium]
MRQRWIEAIIIGCTIGVLVLMLKFFFNDVGIVEHLLALVAAGVALFLVQFALSHWTRDG